MSVLSSARSSSAESDSGALSSSAMSESGFVLLETFGLGIDFGGVHAVADVDFRLEPNELRCLIGPNGAGKSTFFKLLTGQHRPTSGEIHIRGKNTIGLQSHEIARLGVGIKTQVPSVFEGLDVRENIELSCLSSGPASSSRAKAAELLEQLQLDALQDRRVGELAHGQRQWVELAMVMAAEPELILLDEPAAGMTDEEVERTATLILGLRKRCAVIVVEHDMSFIKLLASTVTVFNQGRVLIEGPVETVLADESVRDVYLGKQLAAELGGNK